MGSQLDSLPVLYFPQEDIFILIYSRFFANFFPPNFLLWLTVVVVLVVGSQKIFWFCSKKFQMKFRWYKCSPISVFVTSCLEVEKNPIWGSKFWKFEFKLLMGNRPFFASLDFFMRSDPALFLKLRALKLLIPPPQPDTIAHPITQTSPQPPHTPPPLNYCKKNTM